MLNVKNPTKVTSPEIKAIKLTLLEEIGIKKPTIIEENKTFDQLPQRLGKTIFIEVSFFFCFSPWPRHFCGIFYIKHCIIKNFTGKNMNYLATFYIFTAIFGIVVFVYVMRHR